ncbi:hypothetical protein ACFXD5_06150 [Streptomyces sp. NPDC059385]|uniref:hypothetical protein n=1 Tax=Streptomyces sp. NPDC059385 TaxID=3346817 RepID=UPI0036C5CB7F
MTESDDERLTDLGAVTRPEDPRFARRHRQVLAWTALLPALAAMVTGAMVPHGMLLAAGLVMAALAVNLFDPDRPRRWPTRSERHGRLTRGRPGPGPGP